MKQKILNQFFWLRRKIASFIIPEIYWPKELIIDGAKIKLRDTPYTFGVKLGLKNGNYELPERNLLQFLNLKGETIIEMGGSIGILTAILSHKIGDEGRIVSIEASEKLSTYSKNWLEKNKNTKVVTGFAFPVYQLKKSISIENFDETGTSLTGTLEFKASNVIDSEFDKNKNIFDIKKVCNLYQINPSVLVIDIEGSEKILLDEKPDIPDSIKSILIELHPNIYGELIEKHIISAIENEGFCIKLKHADSYLFERNK